VKKPLTAETAETAEKNLKSILGVLCGKTAHFHRSSRRHSTSSSLQCRDRGGHISGTAQRRGVLDVAFFRELCVQTL